MALWTGLQVGAAVWRGCYTARKQSSGTCWKLTCICAKGIHMLRGGPKRRTEEMRLLATYRSDRFGAASAVSCDSDLMPL